MHRPDLNLGEFQHMALIRSWEQFPGFPDSVLVPLPEVVNWRTHPKFETLGVQYSLLLWSGATTWSTSTFNVIKIDLFSTLQASLQVQVGLIVIPAFANFGPGGSYTRKRNHQIHYSIHSKMCVPKWYQLKHRKYRCRPYHCNQIYFTPCLTEASQLPRQYWAQT